MDGLLINGYNAYSTYGVMMDEGFLDALSAPAPLKDFLTFESRVTDGTEYLLVDANNQSMAKTKARDLTLKFRILSDENQTLSAAQTQLQTRIAAFVTVLQVGAISVKVPDLCDKTYNLVYTGQSITFNYSPQRTSCTIAAKFVEALYAQPPVPVPPEPTPIYIYPLTVEGVPIVINTDATWSSYRIVNAEGTITATSSSLYIVAEVTTINNEPYLRVRSSVVLTSDTSANVTVTAGEDSVVVPVVAKAPVYPLSVGVSYVNVPADGNWSQSYPILNASGTITATSNSNDIVAVVETEGGVSYVKVCSSFISSTTLYATITVSDDHDEVQFQARATGVETQPFTLSSGVVYEEYQGAQIERQGNITLYGSGNYTATLDAVAYINVTTERYKTQIRDFLQNQLTISFASDILTWSYTTLSLFQNVTFCARYFIADSSGLNRELMFIFSPYGFTLLNNQS